MAAAAGAGLCDAVHGGAVRGQARAASRARPKCRSTVVPLGGRFTLGPFDIEFVSVAHSIPESNGAHHPHPARHGAAHRRLEDRPDAGDRAADRRGAGCARSATRAASRCSATPPTRCAKAARRRKPTSPRCWRELISSAPGRVGVTTFASNVARIRAVAEAAAACGREVVLVGRAMERVAQVARETGYLDGIQRIPLARHLRLPAARQGRGALHRQPGRAARGAGAHRRGPASAGDVLAAATA